LVFRGLGAADGFEFERFRQSNNVRFSLPVDPFFGQDFPKDALPVLPMYGAVASQALQSTNGSVAFTEGVAAQLSAQGLSDQQIGTLAQLFGYMGDTSGSTPNIFRFFGQARTDGVQLGIPDDSEDGFRPVDGPTDIDPLEQTTTQTFEVGYKGTIANQVLINVDGYYERKEDFISPLQVESPLAYLQEQGLAEDVGGRLGEIFASPSDPTVQNLISNLESSGVSRAQVAQLLAGIVGSGLNNTPTAVVQPDQQVLPDGGGPNEVGGFLSYRNFGTVEYWGIDASVQVQPTDQLEAFGNVSIVSDDFFDNEELDEANEDLSVALNAPAFKAKGGFDYRLDDVGVTFGATGHYVEGFPVRSGPYVGDVEPYFLLDLRAGYDVPSLSGLRFDVTAKNVLDNEHREFVGAPELGLMLMGRLTYTLP
jgi:iron complex outermembrane receptor protein